MRRLLVGAAALALIAATGVLARSLAGPDPQVLALADGCLRNDTLLQTGREPNWAYVLDSASPANAPPPQQRWASGVVSSNGIPWYSPHVSGGDTPYSHVGYDVNLDVKLDPQYSDLIGTSNDATSGAESGEIGRLHTEREAEATPFFVWPEPGDRVTLRGYWVWDCDHFRASTPNAPITGERTELHPITALWVERAQSPRSPHGESEGDLFVTTDKTQAGKHADCAHRTKGDQEAFKQCVPLEPNLVDMGGSYAFALRLPRGRGRARVRIVDEGSVAPPRIDARVDEATVRVRFTLPHDGKRHVVAKEIFAGRTPGRLRHLRVSVEKVLIRRSMDPGCLPQRAPPCGLAESTHEDQISQGPTGEWNFYWDVAGIWSLWKPYVRRVRDGETIRPNQHADVFLPPDAAFRVLVWPRECDFGRLRLGGGQALFPCPTQPEVGNRSGDDVPGATIATFRGPGLKTLAPKWGIGTCPRRANPKGCYAVTVRVRRVG